MNTTTKTTLALAASLTVNLAVLGALEWSVQQAQVAPGGTVSVAQLPDEIAMAAYIQAPQGAARTVGAL